MSGPDAKSATALAGEVAIPQGALRLLLPGGFLRDRNNAVPEGILKTDQVLRKEEADKFVGRWESFNMLV